MGNFFSQGPSIISQHGPWPSNASSTLSRFALNDVSFFAPRDNDVSVFNSVKYN